jgi:hypothetical protein
MAGGSAGVALHGRRLGLKAPTRSILESPVRATTLLNFLLRLPGTFACYPARWQLGTGSTGMRR